MLLKLEAGGPLYVRVYEALHHAIEAGELRAGARLPGTRELAVDLGVSRTVVTQAYALLESEGSVITHGHAGFFVGAEPSCGGRLEHLKRAHGAEPSCAVPLSRQAERLQTLRPQEADFPLLDNDPEAIDLRYSGPIADSLALDQWRQVLAQTARRAAQIEEPPAWGMHEFRAAVAGYLRHERGVVAEADDVLILTSAQQAFDLTARVLLDPGATVGLEDPYYLGARHAFAAAGARLVGCAVDVGGLDIAQHGEALRDARLLVVSPSHQFPTGAVMSMERRKALLEWTYGRPINLFEDDIGCEYRYGVHAIASLQGSDRHGRVIYCGNFARRLFPGLRVACIVVPPALRESFRAAKWLADRGSSSLMQHAMLHYLASGAYERSRRRLLRVLDAKRCALIAALRRHLGDGAVVRGASAGMALYVELPDLPVAQLDALVTAARCRKLHVYSAAPYFLGRCPRAALVLGYGGTDEERMDEAGRRLAEACRALHGEVTAEGG
ncbi:PLP-dependent aminotransferase family protein [Frateuria defendens]|uniref:MocR-like pyridoxine biosynthesis transcription factor PdxR n=1 Tax=Frateuria defendens TaxID=2219559 RepID=UPI00066FC3D2|nr:PLP-dependent aminotransferase family protein [Frateuria defendens]